MLAAVPLFMSLHPRPMVVPVILKFRERKVAPDVADLKCDR